MVEGERDKKEPYGVFSLLFFFGEWSQCVCVCVSEGFKVCRGLKRGRVGVMYGWIGVSAVGDFFLLCLSLGFWIDRVFDPSLGTVRYGVGSGFEF